MNAASLLRIDVARTVLKAYEGRPGVRAAVVHGSAARGWADQRSDVEIKVFWVRPPEDEERAEAARQAGGDRLRFWPYDPGNIEWSDGFHDQGLRIDMSHSTVEETEQWLTDVVGRYDPSLHKQQVAALVHYGLPVMGEDLMAQWKARIARYPDGLAEAMVRKHLTFTSRPRLEALADRGDFLALYDALFSTERRILIALLAVNRTYFTHLGFKWITRLVDELAIVPADLLSRLHRVFQVPLPEAVREIGGLIDETFSLVAGHIPGCDISEARQRYGGQRIHDEREE